MAERVRLSDEDKPGTLARVSERLDERAQPTKRKKGKRRLLRMTEANVAALRIDKAKSYMVWDHGTDAQRGLAVMVLPSGAKTYYAYYNFPRQPSKSMALGRVGEMSLEQARERTGKIRGKAKEGIDPRAEDPARSLTFGELLNAWHEREQVGRKGNKTADATKAHVLHHFGKLKNRPAATIRFQEVDDVLCEIRDVQKKPYTALKLHAHVAALFRWSVKSRRLAMNPIAGMDKPWNKAKPRERTWFAGERADALVKELWALAGELGGDEEKFIKLLILTGKRRSAVQNALRWEHISADWYWNPPQRLFSAQKRFTPIPLPRLVQRILGKRPERDDAVVCMPESSVQPLLDTVRKKLVGKGYEHFLWHGLRHIFETRTGELGVLPHVRDLLLDHEVARSATGRGYDHGAYKAQLLEALELWAGHVANLVAPGKDVAVLR